MLTTLIYAKYRVLKQYKPYSINSQFARLMPTEEILLCKGEYRYMYKRSVSIAYAVISPDKQNRGLYCKGIKYMWCLRRSYRMSCPPYLVQHELSLYICDNPCLCIYKAVLDQDQNQDLAIKNWYLIIYQVQRPTRYKLNNWTVFHYRSCNERTNICSIRR